MGNDYSRERELEEQLRREEANARDELWRHQTENAQQQAQNERLERERIEGDLKAERATAQSKAEAARMQIEHQRQQAESKREREREQIRRAEERENRLSHEKQRLEKDVEAAQTREKNVRRDMYEKTRMLESQRNFLQLEMEKRKGETEKQLTKKEEELRRSQLEASNLQRKMDYERSAYDQRITMKDEEVADARERAELIRVEKDRMGKNLEGKIQEQLYYRVQEQKEARIEQRGLFLQWKSDSERHHATQMQQQIDFQKKLEAKDTRTIKFMERVQNQTLAHQTKQLELLSMGLQNITGSGQPTAALTNMKSSTQTSIGKKLLRLEKPCIVMIDNFKQGEALKAVVNDEEIIQDLFEHTPADVRPVLNGKTITRSARSCQREDYSANDGIIVFLFSYGNNMTLQDDSRKVDIGRILEFFAKNSSLVDKPKMLFVQAIRKIGGEKCEEGKLYESTDYLLCYCEMAEATYIEKADAREGSIFIKSLQDAFTANKKCDIGEILEIVEDFISDNIDADFSFRVENKLNARVQLYIP